MYRTHTCGCLRACNVNQTVTLAGWVQKVRNLGAMTFIDLRDRYGITQIVVEEHSPAEARETVDMQGKERKEMRNPRNEPPGTGRRFGDLLGGPDFGQPFLTDNYSTALSSSTRLAYSLPTVNSSPFSIRNAPLKVLPSCGTGFPSTFSSVIR